VNQGYGAATGTDLIFQQAKRNPGVLFWRNPKSGPSARNERVTRMVHVQVKILQKWFAFIEGSLRRSLVAYLRLVALAVLLATTADCSLFSHKYECSEEGVGADARCGCTAIPIWSSSVPCKREYDCCAELTTGSILPDDPSNNGSHCNCWMLQTGRTCEDARVFGSESIESRPASCPPR
jgi:hypothetical protein